MSETTLPTPFVDQQPTIGRALRRVLRQPSFVVAVVVLLTAALGLNASVKFMQLHFKKEPVPLAHELNQIGDRFGSWVQVSQDQPLDKEMQDVLGTDKYVFRDYIDESVVGPGTSDRFKGKTVEERGDILKTIRRSHPNGVVNLAVTYYTGMVDTVAHVPDRCVTADGYEPKSYDTKKW